MKLLKLLGYVWALPNTLVGFLLLATLYFPKSLRWQHGALEAIPWRAALIGGGWVGAQTYGWLIFAKNELNRDNVGLAAHERVHVRHALRGGVFFAILYVAFFLYWWGFGLRCSWRDAYRNNWFERVAYAEGDLVQAASDREAARRAADSTL